MRADAAGARAAPSARQAPSDTPAWALVELAAAVPRLHPDCASAEQVAMSVAVLRAHGGQATQSAAVDDLFDTLRDDDRFDAARFRRLLERIGR